MAAALLRLEVQGPEALSLRSLAADLGVTPMSLYSHVAGIDDILDALATDLLADMPATSGQNGPGLEAHLSWYCERILRQPGLSRAIILRQGQLPRPHADWTARLRQLLAREALPEAWADILVDHLHGFAIPHVSARSASGPLLEAYCASVAIILAAARRR